MSQLEENRIVFVKSLLDKNATCLERVSKACLAKVATIHTAIAAINAEEDVRELFASQMMALNPLFTPIPLNRHKCPYFAVTNEV